MSVEPAEGTEETSVDVIAADCDAGSGISMKVATEAARSAFHRIIRSSPQKERAGPTAVGPYVGGHDVGPWMWDRRQDGCMAYPW